MPTTVARRWPVLVAILTLLLGLGVALGAHPSGAATRPVALVYRGPAGCDGCSEAVAALLQRSPRNFAVSYIGPNETKKLTAANLAGATLYAQPGGDGSVGHAMKVMGTAQTNAIRSYVHGGGRYLGFCMGAYLAGSNPGMGMLAPGDTDEYSASPGALVHGSDEAVIPINWGSTQHDNYVQDAPYIIPSGVTGERILSTFTNGKVNALTRPYGSGALGVVGSHPEADRSWYTDALWAQDHDGLDYALGLQVLEATMTT